MVRVASLKSQVEAGIINKNDAENTPENQLKKIRSLLIPLLKKQTNHYKSKIRPLLKKNKVLIVDYKDLNARQKKWITKI